MTIIETLQVLIPNATVNQLEVLVDQAKVFATDYCNLATYSEDLDSVVILMVQENYNRISAQGVSSRSYSGISENYLNDFSDTVYTPEDRQQGYRIQGSHPVLS